MTYIIFQLSWACPWPPQSAPDTFARSYNQGPSTFSQILSPSSPFRPYAPASPRQSESYSPIAFWTRSAKSTRSLLLWAQITWESLHSIEPILYCLVSVFLLFEKVRTNDLVGNFTGLMWALTKLVCGVSCTVRVLVSLVLFGALELSNSSLKVQVGLIGAFFQDLRWLKGSHFAEYEIIMRFYRINCDYLISEFVLKTWWKDLETRWSRAWQALCSWTKDFDQHDHKNSCSGALWEHQQAFPDTSQTSLIQPSSLSPFAFTPPIPYPNQRYFSCPRAPPPSFCQHALTQTWWTASSKVCSPVLSLVANSTNDLRLNSPHRPRLHLSNCQFGRALEIAAPWILGWHGSGTWSGRSGTGVAGSRQLPNFLVARRECHRCTFEAYLGLGLVMNFSCP